MSRYLGIAVGLLAVSMSPQDTEVKGARVSVVRKPSAVMNVTIENRRDSPLVAWEIGLSEPGASFARMTSGSDFSGRKAEPGHTSGPIAPHERRTVAVDLSTNPAFGSAALQLAVFDDGHSEGIPAVLELWRKARQARVDDLRYWSGVFELMPRVSETDLRGYLTSRLADRAGQVVANPNAPGVRWKLQEVLRRYPSGPDVWSGLDALRAETQRELAALTRQPPGIAPTTGAVTSAVILTQDRVASGTLVATIENLRAVPIEAFKLELLRPTGGTSGLGMDFCDSEPPQELGRGPIKPGEIREIPRFGTIGLNDALPFVRLSYVIFDDLSYEGEVAGRDEALRKREERATDYAFAAAMLGQVVERPAAEIQTFLMEKRAERARQLQASGRTEMLMLIDELIRQAKDSPDRLLANAKEMKERYERVRQRLLRHVGR